MARSRRSASRSRSGDPWSCSSRAAGGGHPARPDAGRGGRARARGSPYGLARGRRVPVAEVARLLAVPADLHRAPGPGAVARLVVEGDAAVLVATALQPLPLVGRRELRDRRDDASGRTTRSVVCGSEDGTTVLEPDAEARLAPGLLQRLRGRGSVRLDAVVHEEKLPDRLAHGEGVCELLLGRLHEIVDETLLREPHGQLVCGRDPVDPGLEIQRVDVVADEVQLRM